ncbi:MAG: hypothetical protein D8M59_13910 [Planctomycetes bacterium]|nr:hypothetical protein [Planctomycetota bacterium]NOG55604.1 amidohydrolase family protein [Planctomycetota bacterium]
MNFQVAQSIAPVAAGLCTAGVFVSSVVATAAAPPPGDPMRQEVVVIKAGKVITVSGEEYAPGEIVIIDGKVELVGRGLEYPKPARVIEAPYETVMPGFVHPHSRYGMARYSASGVHGNYKADEYAVVDDIEFEDFLKAGFTTVCYFANGTGIPGTSVVYRTGGAEDDRVLKGTSYLRVTMSRPSRDKRAFAGALDKAKAEIDKVEKAKKEWEEAQKKKKEEEEAAKKKQQEEDAKKEGGQPEKKADAAGKGDEKKENGEDGEKPAEPEKFEPPKIDPAVQPLVDWLEGNLAMPPLIEVSSASDVVHFDDVMKKWEDKELAYRLYLTRGGDYNYVMNRLVEGETIVMSDLGVRTLPQTMITFNMVGELFAAGCEIALVPVYDAPVGFDRFRADVTELIRYGITREEALRAVTLNSAKLIGVDDRVGSIEKGKDADFVFVNGDDPLDPLARISRVMILGETVWESEDDADPRAMRSMSVPQGGGRGGRRGN